MKFHDRQTVLVMGGLLLLAAVPVAAGLGRLHDLAFSQASPESARFFVSPIPIVVHVVSSLIFAIFWPFQLVDKMRIQFPKAHRYGGYMLVFAGLASALSGIWMTVFYVVPPEDRRIVALLRLIFGTAMTVSLLLGVGYVLKRNFAAHRRWMIRGYAIGLGAGTQVLTHLPWFVFVGMPDEAARTALMGAGWLINLAIAEVIIRHKTQPVLRGRVSRISGSKLSPMSQRQ